SWFSLSPSEDTCRSRRIGQRRLLWRRGRHSRGKALTHELDVDPQIIILVRVIERHLDFAYRGVNAVDLRYAALRVRDPVLEVEPPLQRLQASIPVEDAPSHRPRVER